MPRGGRRDGAGAKAKDGQPRPQRAIAPIRPQAKAYRTERITRRLDGRLDSLEVMQENMEFYHVQAGQILATIMMMPAGDGGDRLEALMKFADAAKMRASSQAVAEALAKYQHHPKGAEPFAEPAPDPNADQGALKVIEHNPELDATLGKFAAARRPAAAATNGHANGGGHNGTNGHG